MESIIRCDHATWKHVENSNMFVRCTFVFFGCEILACIVLGFVSFFRSTCLIVSPVILSILCDLILGSGGVPTDAENVAPIRVSREP